MTKTKECREREKKFVRSSSWRILDSYILLKNPRENPCLSSGTTGLLINLPRKWLIWKKVLTLNTTQDSLINVHKKGKHNYGTSQSVLPACTPRYGHNWSQFSSVQLLSHFQLFDTPWTAACQDSLSITNSLGLLKLMSIQLVMPSNHLNLCRPLLLLHSIIPSIRVFSKKSVLYIKWQSIRASASASVLPMNIQDWFPLGWAGWISL